MARSNSVLPQEAQNLGARDRIAVSYDLPHPHRLRFFEPHHFMEAGDQEAPPPALQQLRVHLAILAQPAVPEFYVNNLVEGVDTIIALPHLRILVQTPPVLRVRVVLNTASSKSVQNPSAAFVSS